MGDSVYDPLQRTGALPSPHPPPGPTSWACRRFYFMGEITSAVSAWWGQLSFRLIKLCFKVTLGKSYFPLSQFLPSPSSNDPRP